MVSKMKETTISVLSHGATEGSLCFPPAVERVSVYFYRPGGETHHLSLLG